MTTNDDDDDDNDDDDEMPRDDNKNKIRRIGRKEASQTGKKKVTKRRAKEGTTHTHTTKNPVSLSPLSRRHEETLSQYTHVMPCALST